MERVPRFPQSIILEGGSIHVDGEGNSSHHVTANWNPLALRILLTEKRFHVYDEFPMLNFTLMTYSKLHFFSQEPALLRKSAY